MENNENNENKFYCPVCRIPECGGILQFKINKNNFSLNYECDKNKDHCGQNIYFKTFERFYLKEMNKDICKRCNSILKNNLKYKCKLCEHFFCTSCFTFHKHFMKNIDNILIISTNCEIHNNNIMYYCLECKKYICNFCIKNSNIHEEHKKINLYELMPSKQTLKNFERRMEEYDDLIYKINLWLDEFNQKILRLKQNILDEKDLLQKLSFNFNQNFINYSYFENFNYLNEYSKNFNNEYLDKFITSKTFEKKSEMLFEYILQVERNQKIKIKINKDINLKCCNELNNDNFTKIADNYFFKKSKKIVVLIKYAINKDKLIKKIKAKISFLSKIYSVSVFHNSDKNYTIYACLFNNKKVAIFDINLSNDILSLNNNEISKQDSGHFLKSIKLNNELVATSDNDNIIDIWFKDPENKNGYTHINSIKLITEISNILSVNSEYFVTSHRDKKIINFYEIQSLSMVKSLNKIDSIKGQDSLLLYDNKYIIINCCKGFAIIYIKTKELVQYIEDFLGFFKYDEKEFILNSNNNIYIIYKKDKDDSEGECIDSESDIVCKKYEIKIFVIKYIDDIFQMVEEYEKFENEENLHLTYIDDERLLLFDNNIYRFK